MQLLESLYSKNGSSLSVPKSNPKNKAQRRVTIPLKGEAKELAYTFYDELHREINLKEALVEFKSFIPTHYNLSAQSEDMCLLMMSRMELERQLRRDQGVCSSVATVDLPLGPLNRLEIQKNAFLEAYLAIMTYTTALDKREPTEEVMCPCNATVIPRDPLAAIDESSGGVVSRIVAAGGELSASAIEEILPLGYLQLDGSSRVSEEEEPLEKAHAMMCSRESTPCQLCDQCDPFCSTYLASHVAFFHPDNGQTSRSLDGNHLALIESSVREDDDASSLMIGDDDEPIIIGGDDEPIIIESRCPGVDSTADDEDLEECEVLHARDDVERDEDIVLDDAMGPISVSDAETTVSSRSSKSRRTTDTDMVKCAVISIVIALVAFTLCMI